MSSERGEETTREMVEKGLYVTNLVMYGMVLSVAFYIIPRYLICNKQAKVHYMKSFYFLSVLLLSCRVTQISVVLNDRSIAELNS